MYLGARHESRSVERRYSSGSASASGDDHLIEVDIANLRRKLGDEAVNPRYAPTAR
jgi:DNA-binding response OmpR family regulator